MTLVITCLLFFLAMLPSRSSACDNPTEVLATNVGLSVGLNATGTLLALAQPSWQMVTVLDLLHGTTREVHTAVNAYPLSAAFGPADDLYVLEATTEKLSVYTPAGALRRQWDVSVEGQVVSLAVGNDRVYVLSGSLQSGTLRSWNLEGGDLRTDGSVSGLPVSVTVRDDGAVLVASHAWGPGLNCETRLSRIPSVGGPQPFTGLFRVAATPQGQYLLSGVSELRVLDSDFESICTTFESELVFQSAVMDPAGTIYVATLDPHRPLLRMETSTPVQPMTWGRLKSLYE